MAWTYCRCHSETNNEVDAPTNLEILRDEILCDKCDFKPSEVLGDDVVTETMIDMFEELSKRITELEGE